MDNTKHSTRLCVIGLGYVGLPVATGAAAVGLEVVGLDVAEAHVERLNRGVSSIDPTTDAALADALATGFSATVDPSVLADCDVAVICVPTPLDEHQVPNLAAVRSAAAAVRDHLHPGMLVVLESTTYPGTTDTVLRSILEESGLIAGEDFALAFSPERIDPGNETFTLRNTPKIVGGYTPACTARARDFYGLFVDRVVETTSCREAELAKLLENTYRQVNIALVNEMAVFCHTMGIDLWSAIDAASTKPFGFTAFRPGPGVGGHCIPIDPGYLAHQVRSLGRTFRFVELAQEINNAMPAFVTQRVQNALNERALPVQGSKVLLIGLTYKPDVADPRETPAEEVVRSLRALGADLSGFDPYLERFCVDGVDLRLVGDLHAAVAASDIVVVLQHHRTIDRGVYAMAKAVFDTRGVLTGANVARL